MISHQDPCVSILGPPRSTLAQTFGGRATSVRLRFSVWPSVAQPHGPRGQRSLRRWRVARLAMMARRMARLVAWLEAFEGIAPLRIGYAFYDCADNGGALDVLDNPEYNDEFKEVVDNLMDLAIVEEE